MPDHRDDEWTDGGCRGWSDDAGEVFVCRVGSPALARERLMRRTEDDDGSADGR